jgi:hypothetical protein
MGRRGADRSSHHSGDLCNLLLFAHGKVMNQACQMIFAPSGSDVGTPCDKRAVITCADCGAAICSHCRTERCGDSFCELCYDYHVTTSCIRKPVQNVRHALPISWFSKPVTPQPVAIWKCLNKKTVGPKPSYTVGHKLPLLRWQRTHLNQLEDRDAQFTGNPGLVFCVLNARSC